MSILTIIMVACFQEQNDPDPGNRRLAALQSDPASNLTAPFLRIEDEQERERKLGKGLAEKGEGPLILRVFAVTEPVGPEDVLNWFDRKLREMGWYEFHQPPNMNVDAATPRFYRKTIDHWCAGLTIALTIDGDEVQGLRLTLSSAATDRPKERIPCPMDNP